VGEARERLLNPVERISEILFGLIMAVTIVGSLSIAAAGRDEVKEVLVGAVGCNIAWGLVDALMYLVGIATERARNRALAKRVSGADTRAAQRLIAQTLPEHVAVLAGPDELEGMRRRLLALPPPGRLLRGADWLAALAVFILVIVATFPVVVPFLLTSDPALALRLSRAVTVAMLFLSGFLLGRYAGHTRPLATGVAMAALGAVVILAVMALGG
jgi:VIT1/CCC1 family predicted Fe2+/Mn2+ transporter